MPVYNAKSIPAEVHSSTKDPEVAAFLKTGPVLGAHKPIHEQRVEHNAFIDKVKPPIGKIEHFPNPDYAALARACGAVGFKAESPGELRDAIDKALKADGPAIIDCVVAADEMPNVPHLALETISNFAMAKVKEIILAVTGG